MSILAQKNAITTQMNEKNPKKRKGKGLTIQKAR
jgi:hypothetical protein